MTFHLCSLTELFPVNEKKSLLENMKVFSASVMSLMLTHPPIYKDYFRLRSPIFSAIGISFEWRVREKNRCLCLNFEREKISCVEMNQVICLRLIKTCPSILLKLYYILNYWDLFPVAVPKLENLREKRLIK